MTAPPTRRWFRFSLRTMFFILTALTVTGILLCDWLRGQLTNVRERQEILSKIERAMQGQRFVAAVTLESPLASLPTQPAASELAKVEYVRVSSVRRLLGDESCVVLQIPMPLSLDAHFVERAERAFPEARVTVFLPGPDAQRDSLFAPADQRRPNRGTVFKTGLIEK